MPGVGFLRAPSRCCRGTAPAGALDRRAALCHRPDLNDLYRRVINRTTGSSASWSYAAAEVIIRNEKRMLQEAVDALFDNGPPRAGPSTAPRTSAASQVALRHAQGEGGPLPPEPPRQAASTNSGRSVIVVGPELSLHQCGLPKKMRWSCSSRSSTTSSRSAATAKPPSRVPRSWLSAERPEVWDVLEEVIKEHPVMLNRAPTLHRLGIQAFEPVLIEGKAIQLHPLVCTAFNAGLRR